MATSTAIIQRDGMAVARISGDMEREKEIERRMRELGLWEYKKQQERQLVDILDTQIVQQDGLTCALNRCRRRRDKSATEEVRNIVKPNVVRNCFGEKIEYQVNVLMGLFTRDLTHRVDGNNVVVNAATNSPEIRLKKEITLELPRGVDMSEISIVYVAGVLKIRVPYSRTRRKPTKDKEEIRVKPVFTSISPIYSLQQRLASLEVDDRRSSRKNILVNGTKSIRGNSTETDDDMKSDESVTLEVPVMHNDDEVFINGEFNIVSS